MAFDDSDKYIEAYLAYQATQAQKEKTAREAQRKELERVHMLV